MTLKVLVNSIREDNLTEQKGKFKRDDEKRRVEFNTIDNKALELAKEYKKCEAELLEIIMEVDRLKVFRKFGYNSLFQYVVQRLEISESQAYGFINVARKSCEVPKLKESIKNGTLTISKARRVTSVLNKDNQDQWLELAEKSSQKKVEREVALASPNKSLVEKMTYKSAGESIKEKVLIKRDSPRVKLELGISEQAMIKLRRIQDLVSQKRKKSENLESTLNAILDDYLRRHDPIEKAKRNKIRSIGKSQKVDDTKKRLKDQEKRGVNERNGALRRPLMQKSQPSKPLKSKIQQSSRRVVSDNENKRIEKKYKSKRRSIPASLKHQVYLKTDGRCQAIDRDGKRCDSSRFLEIHHIQPLSQGGEDKIENLTLLCSGHHKAVHDQL